MDEANIMVWAAVSIKGKLPLVFVKSGVKVNANHYLNSILKDVLKPTADIIYKKAIGSFNKTQLPLIRQKSAKNGAKINSTSSQLRNDLPTHLI